MDGGLTHDINEDVYRLNHIFRRQYWLSDEKDQALKGISRVIILNTCCKTQIALKEKE